MTEQNSRRRIWRIDNNSLFAFVVLRYDRRHVIHFNVTAHPTAEWTAQQIVEALPFNEAPRFMIRDRDSIDGESFQRRVKHMDLEEVVCAPKSPWQNPYCERLIGSIRRIDKRPCRRF